MPVTKQIRFTEELGPKCRGGGGLCRTPNKGRQPCEIAPALRLSSTRRRVELAANSAPPRLNPSRAAVNILSRGLEKRVSGLFQDLSVAPGAVNMKLHERTVVVCVHAFFAITEVN